MIAMWTVYDHPKDHPDHFIARRWEGLAPTETFIKSTDINVVREHMMEMGLTKLMRDPNDDPVILEVWL